MLHRPSSVTFIRSSSLRAFCALAVVLFSLVGQAADDLEFDKGNRTVYDLPEPVAIQGRKYQMSQSLLVTAGYLPSDSFNKGFTITAGYKLAFTPYLTWEILSFGYIINRETQLKKDLLALNVGVQNIGLGGVLDYPRQIYMTGLHYSPMYSKSLLFNSKLVYSETSVFLGTGTLNFNQVGHKPMLAPGVTWRMYMGPRSAVTAYFRDYFYMDDNTGITGIIDFGLGFEFKFGGGPS